MRRDVESVMPAGLVSARTLEGLKVEADEALCVVRFFIGSKK